MKKYVLLIVIFTIAIFAQTQVQRDKVIVEIVTGTW
jgi:hypothetical protein